MAFVNIPKKEVSLKIVYYGPALSGKTTNVERIHMTISPEFRGRMTSLCTKQDRTLYFDFLPLRSNVIKGFTSKFQIYTVPGQVIYNQTRKLVLNGVDGVVFVADSQWSRMEDNVDSFSNLEENLREQGNTLDKLPYLLQFNKRDAKDVAPEHYMDYLLNRRAMAAPTFNAVAVAGDGVLETLNTISKMVLVEFMRQNRIAMAGEVPGDVAVAEPAP